jgi:hypothetical protein
MSMLAQSPRWPAELENRPAENWEAPDTGQRGALSLPKKKTRWRTGGVMKTKLNFLAAAEPEQRRATKGGQGRRAW